MADVQTAVSTAEDTNVVYGRVPRLVPSRDTVRSEIPYFDLRWPAMSEREYASRMGGGNRTPVREPGS
jgi:hypothetical protein